MNAREIVENTNLRPYVRKVPQGSYLFRQGEKASTMFLILKGQVRLIGEGKDGEMHLSNRLGEGEMLGERVIATSRAYPRSLTAFAETDLIVLEFSLRDFQKLQSEEPIIASLMFKKIVNLLIRRWDEARRIASFLRSSDNRVRIVLCIRFFADCLGKSTPGGMEVIVDPNSIHHYIDATLQEIEKVIEELVQSRILKKIATHCYLLHDLSLLEKEASLSKAA